MENTLENPRKIRLFRMNRTIYIHLPRKSLRHLGFTEEEIERVLSKGNGEKIAKPTVTLRHITDGVVNSLLITKN